MVSSVCTSNEPSAECLVHRLAALPLVNDALTKAVATYESTKHYAPVIQSTLGVVERSVQIAAAKAKPVYDGYVHESVVIASKVACKGLDRIEESYPAVKMTPEQLGQVSQTYYDQSYLKRGVDTIVATKDYSSDKVTQTRAYYTQALNTLIDYGASVVAGSLDYCDDVVDKYIVEEKEQEDEITASTSYKERVQSISSRLAQGLSTKAARQAGNARSLVQKTLVDLRGAMALLDYVKSTRQWAEQSTSALAGNVATLKEQLEQQAKQYNLQPEVLLLRWVKMSAAMLSLASNEVLQRSLVYLPVPAKNSLEATNSYLHYLDQSFSEAQTLTDIKDELLSEAKHKLSGAEKGLLYAVDKITDYPPLSWMGIKTNSQSGEQSELMENSVD